MRSADFFIDKAKEYSNSIDGILPNLPSQESPDFKPSPEQSEQISDIRNKTKLLFSEFDNGEIFEKNIEAIDHNKKFLGGGWMPERSCVITCIYISFYTNNYKLFAAVQNSSKGYCNFLQNKNILNVCLMYFKRKRIQMPTLGEDNNLLRVS